MEICGMQAAINKLFGKLLTTIGPRYRRHLGIGTKIIALVGTILLIMKIEKSSVEKVFIFI